MREESAILIFKFVADGGLCPTAWCVVALVHEAGAVDMSGSQERAIDESVETAPAGIGEIVLVQPLRVVLIACQAVLPPGRHGNQQFAAGQKIVRAGTLVLVGRKDSVAVETPLSRHSRASIGMPGTHTKKDCRINLHSNISALKSIPVFGVGSLPIGLELICEGVVIEP